MVQWSHKTEVFGLVLILCGFPLIGLLSLYLLCYPVWFGLVVLLGVMVFLIIRLRKK